MTPDTVYLYVKTSSSPPDSAVCLAEALQAFWKKTGLEEEELARTPKGKPYFPSERVFLSVTHTGNLYAAVFSSRPIGIDAEKTAEDRPKIAEKKFSPEERLLPFSYVWCAKEAVAKLVGEGLGAVHRVSVTENGAQLDGRGYALRRITVAEYSLLIATEEGWDYGAETLSEK